MTPDARGFLEVLSPDLNVWSIVRPFSGLGLLEVLFTGGAKVAEYVGVIVLDDDGDGVYKDEEPPADLTPTTACSELFLDNIAGR